jgi:hypothetical protein
MLLWRPDESVRVYCSIKKGSYTSSPKHHHVNLSFGQYFDHYFSFFFVGHNIPFRNLLPGSLAPSTDVKKVEGTGAVTWRFNFHVSDQFHRLSGGQAHGFITYSLKDR